MEKRRPPPHIRSQLDLGYKITRQSVELFEIRPRWNDPQTILERPFAKATYVKTQRIWKIYWRRADLKWHSYQPVPEVKSIDEFFDVVDRDKHACFFG